MSSARSIVLARLRASRRALVGALGLAMLLLLAIFADLVAGDAPLVAPGSPEGAVIPGIVHPARIVVLSDADLATTFPRDRGLWPVVRAGPERETGALLAAPSSEHPLGTDERGRDVFARLVFGARTAVGIGLAAILVSLVIGAALGGAAGFVSRAWDARLERFVELAGSFPVVVVVAIVRVIEHRPSVLSLVAAVAVVRSAEVARLVRAEVLRASPEDYVLAGRALGASRGRIFWRHMVPNIVGPVLVSATVGIGSIALVEAAVSFLEIGKPLTTASWGEMLAEAARHSGETRLFLYPAALLFATVGATYLAGDALRQALDSRIPPRRG
jgi:peptide/nickel transport system permease protein